MHMETTNTGPRIENVAAAISEIRATLPDLIPDEGLRAVFHKALAAAERDPQSHFDDLTADYVRQVGGLRTYIGAMAILKLGDVADEPATIDRLHRSLVIPFWHVPGSFWELAQKRLQERLKLH